MTFGLPLIGRPTTQSMQSAAGSASDTGSQPRAFASVMMIGIMMIVRTVFDVVSRWLYIITATIDREGDAERQPSRSMPPKSLRTAHSAAPVSSSARPPAYAPALKIRRCQGMSASAHCRTPQRGKSDDDRAEQRGEGRADLHAEPAHVEDVRHPEEEHEAEDRERLLLARSSAAPSRRTSRARRRGRPRAAAAARRSGIGKSTFRPRNHISSAVTIAIGAPSAHPVHVVDAVAAHASR